MSEPAAAAAGPVPAAAAPLVELRGIRKSYGALLVSDGVDLTLRRGEVHALLGENGAGKTTLMRILYGLTRPDAGEVRVGGRSVSIASPRDAIANGIGMVTQHFALVRPMTVTENVLLTTAGLGRVDVAAARRRVLETADRLGVRVDPDRRIDSLSVGEQQRVEILKALYNDCRVLVLDEPTAVLVPQDAEALFQAVRRLTADGLGVLFISHKLREVTAVSDRISVLRRGRIVETLPNAEVSPRHLAELMVGRPTVGVRRSGPLPEDAAADVDLAVAAPTGPPPEAPPVGQGLPDAVVEAPVLELDDVSVGEPGRRRALDRFTIRLQGGEIVGVAGVSGNGQQELVEVLTGSRAPTSGRVRLLGRDVTAAGPSELVAAGLGRIPEDRHSSVVAELPVETNLVLESLAAFRRGPLLDRRRVRRYAEELIERFDIKARPEDEVGSLSGGNMQKVLLARVLSRDPKAIVVAQPTRGLDVGAAEFVHRQLLARRAAGAAVLLVSEDLEELLALTDRLVVLFEGRLVGEMATAEATPHRLGLLMAGQVA